jgi:heme/copper-type cytochrome/quinol oxidase subunit 4
MAIFGVSKFVLTNVVTCTSTDHMEANDHDGQHDIHLASILLLVLVQVQVQYKYKYHVQEQEQEQHEQ